MTPTQAAKIIGCSPTHVRHLIRQGTLEATYTDTPGGFYYDVTQTEAERYKRNPQKSGWPRGQKR